MFELPIFPLNLVLMPLQPLALHIFEDRYKQMISDCIANDTPFGVVLLEQGLAEEGRSNTPPSPHRIGTTAHITQVQQLPEGRMNIIVVGRDRFRVHDFLTDKPYLVGVVDREPMMHEGVTIPEISMRGLSRSVMRYLKVLEQGGRIQPSTRELPSDPSALAFLASALLHDISTPQRQTLLESDDLSVMLERLRVLYRREIVLLQAMLDVPDDGEITPFSPN